MSTAYEPGSTEGEVSSSRSRSTSKDVGEGGRRSAIAGATERVREEAKNAAKSLTSEAREKIWSKLDEQVGSGADLMEDVANSVRSAADELERSSPRLAGFARSAAGTIETYADSMRNRSVDELLRAGTKFARKQPALVFGAAALAGFALYRVLSAETANGRERGNGEHLAGSDPGSDEGASYQRPNKPKRRKMKEPSGGEFDGR